MRGPRAACKRRQLQSRGDVPIRRKILEGEKNPLVAAFRNIHENHRGIYESVVFAELRSKRAGAVPIDRIADSYQAFATNMPGELVDLVDCKRLRSCERGDSLDAAAEVANFIQRVSSRDLKGKIAVHVRNIDGDVKEMLRWIVQRHLV